MPRYFFHVYHERLQVDRVGAELPDRNAAWKEATATAGRLLQDIDGELLLSKQPWCLEVTDEFATPLFLPPRSYLEAPTLLGRAPPLS